MKVIKLSPVTNKNDKRFIEYYKKDERIEIMAYLICALEKERRAHEDNESYELLTDTISELWDELDAWNEVADR